MVDHTSSITCCHLPSCYTATKLYCLVTEAHGCEQLAHSRYAAAPRPGITLTASWSQVRHHTITPLHSSNSCLFRHLCSPRTVSLTQYVYPRPKMLNKHVQYSLKYYNMAIIQNLTWYNKLRITKTMLTFELVMNRSVMIDLSSRVCSSVPALRGEEERSLAFSITRTAVHNKAIVGIKLCRSWVSSSICCSIYRVATQYRLQLLVFQHFLGHFMLFYFQTTATIRG